MRLGILGDIHGYLPGSGMMCIDFAVHLTRHLAVDAFVQVGDLCHDRAFARPLYWLCGNNDWPPHEYYILDTKSGHLERYPSRRLA